MKESTFSKIMAMDEDEFAPEEERIFDNRGHFKDVPTLLTHPAHFSVFLHYALSYNKKPIFILFWMSTCDIKRYNYKQLKRWVEDINRFYNGQLIPRETYSFAEVEKLLAKLKQKSVKEMKIRSVFDKYREECQSEIEIMLNDFMIKRSIGIITSTDMNEIANLQTFEEECEQCKKILIKLYNDTKAKIHSEVAESNGSIIILYAIRHYLLYLNFNELENSDFKNSTEDDTEKNTNCSTAYSRKSPPISHKSTIVGMFDFSSSSKTSSLAKEDARDAASVMSILNNLTFSSTPDLMENMRAESIDVTESNHEKIMSNEANSKMSIRSSDSLTAKPSIQFRKKAKRKNDYKDLAMEITQICQLIPKSNEEENEEKYENITWSQFVSVETIHNISSIEIESQESIFELITTEFNYVKKLNILKNIYMKILTSKNLITPRHSSFLFCRIDKIFDIHSKFSNDLRLALEQNHFIKNISEIILKHFDGEKGEEMKRAYSAFCSLNKIGLDFLKAITKEDSELDVILKVIQSRKESKRLSFYDIHACIYQRITKYPLLFDAIRKKVLKNHEANKDELEAINRMVIFSKKLLEYVNKASEEISTMRSLCRVFRNISMPQNESIENIIKEKIYDMIDKKCIMKGLFECKRKNFSELFVIFYENEASVLTKKGDLYFPVSFENMFISYENIILRENAVDNKSLYFILNTYSKNDQPSIFPLIVADNIIRDQWIQTFNTLLSNSTAKKNNSEPNNQKEVSKISDPLPLLNTINVDIKYIFDSIKNNEDINPTLKLFLRDLKDDRQSFMPVHQKPSPKN